MPNNVINKVVFEGRTLIDLTSTTATASTIMSGHGAFGADGVWVDGTASPGAENGDIYQDESGYLVLGSEPGTNLQVLSFNVSSNGTYTAPSGFAYSPVNVSVGPARSAADLTVSGSVVSGLSGYYSEAFSKAISAGDIKLLNTGYNEYYVRGGINLTSSTGYLLYSDNTYRTVSAKINSPGYISSISNDSYHIDISVDKTLPTLSSQTYTPGTVNQVINQYQWLTGNQTILGDANLVPSNIASGVSIFGVTGTHQGGGVEQPYYSVYRDIAISALNGSETYTSEWTNSLSIISRGFFYGTNLRGSLEFNNVVNVSDIGFATGSGLDYAPWSINLPKCTVINQSAFAGRNCLTEVTANSCMYIYSNAFSYCIGLSKISFQNCTTIWNAAFSKCIALSEAVFPNVTSISSYAFTGCTSLLYASFPKCESLHYGAFYECGSLVSINIESCKVVGENAFHNCKNLESIYLPSCTTISNNGFDHCSAMSYAYTPNVTYIGYGAFYGCALLSEANFPNCTSMGNNYGGNQFKSCSSLTYVNLGSYSGILYSGAFDSCTRLVRVSIPEVTYISDVVFRSCYSLESINIPKCSWIGPSAFYSCINLSFVDASMANVWNSAFERAENLRKAFIGPRVSARSFSSCVSLSVVVMNETSTSNIYIGGSAFVGCSKLESLYLLGSSLGSLANINAFTNTPMSVSTYLINRYGSIYVPESLYDSYKTSTNWTTYSSRFVSMTDAEIALEPWNN